MLKITEDLSSFFGLMPIRGRELPAELRLALGLGLDSVKYPCLATLPMGFSWAMYGAQRAHEFLVDSCKLPGRRLHDRCDPVHLDTEPAHVVYVDNFCAFAKTKVKAEEMRDLVWQKALRSGLVVHETFCSSESE